MNPFTFLAVFFATLSVILLYALLAAHDEIKQLRQINIELVTAGTELIANFDELEVRNEWLEDVATRNRDLTAAAVMFVPRYLEMYGNEWIVMRERQEAP